VLPITPAARRQGRYPITATDATNSTDSANSSSPANSTHSSGSADSTHSSSPTNSPSSTDPADPANATRATEVPAPTARYGIRGARAAEIATIDIRVTVKVIVVVDIDVVSTPSAAPAPSTAPERTHHDAYTERYRESRGVVSRRWIVNRRIRIDRRTIDHDWIIGGHVHYLRIRRLDNDYAFAFDHLRFDLLLLGSFQLAFVLRLLAHALHRVHHIGLLSKECIAQIGGPLNVIGQPFNNVGQRR
jgi:hypothetical protein